MDAFSSQLPHLLLVRFGSQVPITKVVQECTHDAGQLEQMSCLQKPWRSFDKRCQGLIPPNLHPSGIPAAHVETGGSSLTSHFWRGKVPKASNLEAKLTQCVFAFLTAAHQSSQLQAHLPSRASPLLSTSPYTSHTCRLAGTCAPSHRSRVDPGKSSAGDAIFGKYLLLPEACTGPRFQTSLHRTLLASFYISSRPSGDLTLSRAALLCLGFSPAAASWRGLLLPTQLHIVLSNKWDSHSQAFLWDEASLLVPNAW